MSKSKKIVLRILPVVLVLMVVLTTNVFAINPAAPSTGTAIDNVTKTTANIWSTLAVIIQVLAIVAIVVAGVRYMFASADSKADIKQQTVILVVGAVLVFAAVPIAQFIQKAATSAMGTTTN